MKTITKNFKLLKDSFKELDSKFFTALFFDFLYYAILIFSALFLAGIIQKKSESVNLAQNFLSITEDAANSLLSDVKGFYYLIIFSIIAYIIMIIVASGLFKGIIWQITAKKQISKKLTLGFLKLNIIWLSIWMIIASLLAIISKPNIAPIYLIILFVLLIYFSNILYPLFIKQTKPTSIKDMIKQSLTIGIKKIHLSIIPYIIIFLLFAIIGRTYNFIVSQFGLNSYYFIIVIVIFNAWARYYFLEVSKKLER